MQSRCAYGRLRVVELVNEDTEAAAVAEEDELLAERGARLASAREEGDRGGPLRCGELRVGDEGVQVRDERAEDGACATGRSLM